MLLMMDSLTRFAMAQREIGLAVGEPRWRAAILRLSMGTAQAAGAQRKFSKGSITGVYTVLVEGDDTNEPIADTVGHLDGHVVLPKAGQQQPFPAIDINAKASPAWMNDIVGRSTRLWHRGTDDGIYEKNADLVSIGAYKAGTNPRLDYAISKIDGINNS